MPSKATLQLSAWVGLAFALLLSAWTTLFVLVGRNPIADVPLVTKEK